MATISYHLEASAGKDENFERMFKNFTFKCLQVIVQSRMEYKPKRIIKESSSADYFCITVADNPAIEEQIRKLLEGVKSFPVKEQSICVEIPLVTNDGDHMFLETWDIHFNLSSLDTTASKLQHVFTRMCVTLKSLLCATRAMPAYKLAKNQGEKGGGFKLNYRFYLGKPQTHFLGDGFRTVRAGAVPTAQGLFTINVSFRTKLLLSPAMSASALQAIEVTDNYFMKEYRASSASSTLSDPQPCSPSQRSPSIRSESPYCFAVSPGSLEKEDSELRARFPSESSPWAQSSILNLEELPEPVVGAFSKPSHKKMVDHKVPFEGLMRRSIMARQEQQLTEKGRQVHEDGDGDVDARNRKKDGRSDPREAEKENVPFDAQRGQKMSIEEEFVMVDKPPFAADDDPRDVKAFLGVFFRAPKTYETQECKVSVEEYLCDVEALVTKLEEDMPVLDEFCQSVINLNSQEEDDESPLFS